MNMKHEPIIVEELGKIWGRDAIFLDKIEFQGTRRVKIVGELNGALCEKVTHEKHISYEITFFNILEFKMIELDFYDSKSYSSSFEKVLNSVKLASYRKQELHSSKIKNSHEHYIFHTYDEIFEVIAEGFDLKLNYYERKNTVSK